MRLVFKTVARGMTAMEGGNTESEWNSFSDRAIELTCMYTLRVLKTSRNSCLGVGKQKYSLVLLEISIYLQLTYGIAMICRNLFEYMA